MSQFRIGTLTRPRLLIIVALLGVVIQFNGCGNYKSLIGLGTSTGNPMGSSDPNKDPAGVPSGQPASASTYTGTLISTLASRLADCHSGTSAQDLTSQLLKTTGYAPLLGLPDGNNSSLGQLQEAEQGLIISAQAESALNCIKAINTMPCSDPNMIQAYDATSTSGALSRSSGIVSSIPACSSFYNK